MAKADVLKRLLTGPFAHCGIRWGLTGTVPKADYEFMGLKCSIGEVANRIQASELQDKGVLANCHVNVLQTQENDGGVSGTHDECADHRREDGPSQRRTSGMLHAQARLQSDRR